MRALLKLFGGDFEGHPGLAVFTIRVEDRSHPVTSGVENYEIYDEQHMIKYYLDREHQLLRSIARNKKWQPRVGGAKWEKVVRYLCPWAIHRMAFNIP